MIMNAFSYFLMIPFFILLIVPSSFFIDAETKGYLSFVRGPIFWRITSSSDFIFQETDITVMPVLINRIFVCGFHCNYHGNTCQFTISIFNISFNDDYRFPQSSFPLQMVWSANRNKPVEVQVLLELTFEGKLMLKDANDTLVWSQGTVDELVSRLNLTLKRNLTLLNEANHIVWQSFDHLTDTLVHGQRLVPGQKLKASVSQTAQVKVYMHLLSVVVYSLLIWIQILPKSITQVLWKIITLTILMLNSKINGLGLSMWEILVVLYGWEVMGTYRHMS